ncbi:hypothetical protein [Escherichia albertii]|uniref:Predicted O-antigen polymerase n=1 Tax=Escherichia albertii TaxID=208962 RepID=A0A5A4U543_ESCAL|nr:hypothetical protein [Escherichia albertii]MCZ9036181.1 hypothetical protein [Escherichia albertii]BBM63185.1 predicted O-antigen polymerase [Escherichia albertii]
MRKKSKFLSVFLCVCLVLGGFVRNIEIMFQFQYYLFFISVVGFIYSAKRLNLKTLVLVTGGGVLFVFFVLKNVVEHGDYINDVTFGFYYIIMLFSVYGMMHILLIKHYIDFRLLIKLFITLNLIGLFGYAITFLLYDYSEVVVYWKYNVLHRSDILNDIRSFVYADEMYPRYNGFYIDPNRWSFCLLIQLIMSDYFFFDAKVITKRIKNILWGVVLLSMILTNSRAGIVSLIVYYVLTRRNIKTLGVMIFFALSVLFYLLYNPELMKLVAYKLTYGVSFTPSINDISESRARINIWYNYLQYIFSDWVTILFGVNMILDPSGTMGITPHNLYIYSMYQGGLLLLFIVICFFTILYYKSSNLSKYLKYGTLAMIMMTFTEDYATLPIFWLYSFFIILLYRDTKTNRDHVVGGCHE